MTIPRTTGRESPARARAEENFVSAVRARGRRPPENLNGFFTQIDSTVQVTLRSVSVFLILFLN